MLVQKLISSVQTIYLRFFIELILTTINNYNKMNYQN